MSVHRLVSSRATALPPVPSELTGIPLPHGCREYEKHVSKFFSQALLPCTLCCQPWSAEIVRAYMCTVMC